MAQVILRFPWQIPLARSIYHHPKWLIPFLLLSALTAGLFEETGRWLGYRLLIREPSMRTGTMFGLGHGGLESILLAGFPLASLAVTWMLAANGSLEGPGLESVRQRTSGLDFWSAQLPALERAGAILFHVGCALIVLRGWISRRVGWLALAIGLHFGVNAVTALLIFVYRVQPLTAELVFVALAVAVLAVGRKVSTASASPGPAIPEAS